MSDDLIPQPKTQLGDLDQHVAGAICYVPVMLLNYIAPILFLAMEPKEHYGVRFHAAQSLLYTGIWLIGTFLGTFLVTLAPVLFIVLGAVVGMEDAFALIGLLLQLIGSLLLLAFVFGGMLGFIALAVLTGTKKDPRIPVLAGLADRFVGPRPVF